MVVLMSALTSRYRFWFLFALMLVGLFAVWWRRSPEAKRGELEIDHPQTYFRRSGFVLMTPPIALPGRKSGRSKTEIWLKLPQAPALDVKFAENGQFLLKFPQGTHLARVESERRKAGKWWVADVRATRLDEAGEWFQVYRPSSLDVDAPLWGTEWLRGDVKAQEAADNWVAELAGSLQSTEPRRTSASQKARANNNCGGCHQYNRPDADRVHQFGPVHRGTDVSGFFVPSTVLRDSAPLEDYAPRELNLDRPFVSVSCPEGELTVHGEEPTRQAKCSGGAPPRAIFDLSSALRASDPTARAVCESRRYLLEHMDLEVRSRFQAQWESCREILKTHETVSGSAP